MQPTPVQGLAKGVEAGFLIPVPEVFQHQQRLAEKDLFGLRLRHAVLVVLTFFRALPFTILYICSVSLAFAQALRLEQTPPSAIRCIARRRRLE